MLGLDLTEQCADTYAYNYPVIYSGKLKIVINQGCYSGNVNFGKN